MWHTGSSSQHAPSPAQPFEARRNCYTWSQAFFWGLSGQSCHGILSKLSPSAWLTIPIEIVPPGTLLAELVHTGCPASASGGCILKGAAGTWLGWSTCMGTGLKVPSCILTITWPRMGSASWACCQSWVVIQATCRPAYTRSKTCKSQLYTSVGLMGP